MPPPPRPSARVIEFSEDSSSVAECVCVWYRVHGLRVPHLGSQAVRAHGERPCCRLGEGGAEAACIPPAGRVPAGAAAVEGPDPLKGPDALAVLVAHLAVLDRHRRVARLQEGFEEVQRRVAGGEKSGWGAGGRCDRVMRERIASSSAHDRNRARVRFSLFLSSFSLCCVHTVHMLRARAPSPPLAARGGSR